MQQTWSRSNNSRSFDSLIQFIETQHLHPEDHYEIAALLESNGWTDQRADDELGISSVFELARQLWMMMNQRLQFQTNAYIEETPVLSRFTEEIRQFLRGMIFAIPMGLSIASMLTLRFSLWSYQYLSVRTATAIAIGTILSFWTVGGFMQAIARRGFYYIYQGYYGLAARTTFRYIGFGVVTSIGISILLFILNTLFPVFPYDMLLLTVGYYFVLNAIWLSVTVMYILRKEFFFTGLIALGIGFVYIGFVWLRMNIIVAQLISMTVVSLVSLLLVFILFQREQREKDKGIRPSLPRIGFTVYTILPYFAYGFLYFMLLFIDRVMAWSTYSPFMQYFIWFRGDYEVGLDFALLTLIMPMGFSEVVVSRIMNSSVYDQRQYLGNQTERLNHMYVRRYIVSVIVMMVVALVSSILTYLGVKWLMDNYLIGQRIAILATYNSNYVFIVGLVSYSILAVALLNSVTMFSLSRPDLVVKPLLVSIGINLVIGFFLSRWINYTDAVWGLAAGALVFTILTSRNILYVFRHFDYHLYLLS